MNASEIEAIFQAQVQNVRELQRAWKHVNRDINQAYVQSQESAARYETKILALLYCALAEAIFSKLIHNPNAFDADAIVQIKKRASDAGVRDGWRKSVELALRAVDAKNGKYYRNTTQTIDRIIDKYIFDPNLLRNKIAHGQWVVALNRENSAMNPQLTTELNQIDVVELYRRKAALETLASVVEDLIKSPNRAHQRDYWEHLVKLEQKHDKMEQWTIEKKVKQLHEKAKHKAAKA